MNYDQEQQKLSARQNRELLKYLLLNESINVFGAINSLNIYRLSARIYDLRKAGYDITTTMVQLSNRRIAVYKLIENN